MAHRTHVPVSVVDPVSHSADAAAEPGLLYALLDAGKHRLHWTESVRARMPSAEDAELLAIGSGTPMLTVRRTTLDEHGRPLLLEETRLCTDDGQLSYDLNHTQ